MRVDGSRQALFCAITFQAAGMCAAAQTVPAKVAAKVAAKTACAATIKLSSLASDQQVLANAEVLAAQMIGNFDKSNPSQVPDIAMFLGQLQIRILAEASQPECTANETNQANSKPATAKAQAKAKTAQTNKQNGSPDTSSGSTSIAQKVGIPQLLGIAVENGAVTNNVNGTTMTLSSTPYGLIYAFLKDEDTQQNYTNYGAFTQVGFSATFNIADSSNPLESATRKQVSQWQAKATFRDTSTRASKVNGYYGKYLDPFAKQWITDTTNAALNDAARSLRKSAEEIYRDNWTKTLESLVSTPVAGDDNNLTRQKEKIADSLLKLLDDDKDYQAALAEAVKAVRDPGPTASAIKQYNTDLDAYNDAEKNFEYEVQELTKGWNGDVTFSEKFPTTTTSKSSSSTTAAAATTTSTATPATPAYLVGELDVTCEPHGNPPTLPAVSSVKPVEKVKSVVGCPFFGNVTFTGNFSGSFYPNPNPTLNEETYRGVQAALLWQWNLGRLAAVKKASNSGNSDNSQATLSLSGNYERLQENQHQKGKKADIALGNLKLEIPISSGVSFPLSFTAANSSEQIKETYVKGNFGISFDLDKLSALLKAKQATQ